MMEGPSLKPVKELFRLAPEHKMAGDRNAGGPKEYKCGTGLPHLGTNYNKLQPKPSPLYSFPLSYPM